MDPGTQAQSEAYALLCTLALDCQSVSTLIRYFMFIAKCFFKLVLHKFLKKNFQYVIKGNLRS